MKKVILLFLISMSGFSQFNYGLKTGILFSNVDYQIENTKFDTKTKINPSIGAFGEYRIGKYGLGIEVNYLSAGYRLDSKYSLDVDEVPENSTSNVNFELLMIYACAKYYPIKIIGFSLGGYYGNVLSVKNKFKTQSVSQEYDYSDMFTKFDYGLSAGVEYAFYKGFFTEIRYSYGLKDYFERDSWLNKFPAEAKKSGHLKSRILGLSLGYKF